MNEEANTTRQRSLPANIGQVTLRASVSRSAVVVLAFGAALLLGAYLMTRGTGAERRFWFAYLHAAVFFLSISVGALFFVILQHLTRARWSVTVRRAAEITASGILLNAILFIPLLINPGAVYPWVHPEHAEELRHKLSWLNVSAFQLRAGIYFVVWILLSQYFLRKSVRQDKTGDAAITARLQRHAAPAMLVYALATALAGFDILMSLDPHWSSTMFGVYFFSGAALGFFAFFAAALMWLQASGHLNGAVTEEHFHDIGKYLFGFVFFWAYIAFSQYLLIWYGNLPEETVWYLRRQQGAWLAPSLVLLFGHFLLPFLGLITRDLKKKRAILLFWALWLLAMRWVDLYWLIMPEFGDLNLTFSLSDAACFIGAGAFYIAGLLRMAAPRALIPIRDPRLRDALHHRSAP